MKYSKQKTGIDLTNTIIMLDIGHGELSLAEYTANHQQQYFMHMAYGAADEKIRTSPFDERVSYLFRLIHHIAISAFHKNPLYVNDVLLPLDEYRAGLLLDFGERKLLQIDRVDCALSHARACPFCTGAPMVCKADNGWHKVCCESCNSSTCYLPSVNSAVELWNGGKA